MHFPADSPFFGLHEEAAGPHFRILSTPHGRTRVQIRIKDGAMRLIESRDDLPFRVTGFAQDPGLVLRPSVTTKQVLQAAAE